MIANSRVANAQALHVSLGYYGALGERVTRTTALDMPAQTHTLVQDSYDTDPVCALTKHNDMRPGKVSQVSRGQVIARMSNLRVTANGLERRVDLVAIYQQLGLTPDCPGVLEYFDEVLPGPRG